MIFSVKLRASLCALCLYSISVFSQPQDWDFYFTNIDDKPASVGLNLALHDSDYFVGKPYCFWIILPFQQSDSLGFPFEKENETLNKIEDELELLLQKSSQTIYAGRTTGAGERYFYYYTKTLDSIDVFIEELFKNYSTYKYKLGQRYDENGVVYSDFLYPSPLDLQLIYNHRIVEALAENGDNSAVPRHIDHWLNFERKKDLNAFIKSLEGTKYLVEKITTDKSNNTHPLMLQVSEENKTDLGTIDNSVIQLFEMAEKFNGIYSGWETFVEAE